MFFVSKALFEHHMPVKYVAYNTGKRPPKRAKIGVNPASSSTNWQFASQSKAYLWLFERLWNEYVTIAVNRNLSRNCEKAREKVYRCFNGIRTRGLRVRAAVLSQPELWRPIHWEPANLLSSSTRERNETRNEIIWTAEMRKKWICDHRSESQFKQLRNSPEKSLSGLQRVGPNPGFLVEL